MADDASRAYFQFPLCLLALGDDVTERLHIICDHSIIAKAGPLFANMVKGSYMLIADPSYDRELLEESVIEEWRSKLHEPACSVQDLKVLILKNQLHITGGDMRTMRRSYDIAEKYLKLFQSRYGRDREVRIPCDWLFETRDKKSFSYREFSLLCALSAILGGAAYKRITRERLAKVALGYKSEAVFQDACEHRETVVPLLTDRQVQTTIEHLHRRKCFAMVSVQRRHIYYSQKLPEDALRQAILKRKLRLYEYRAEKRKNDALLNDAINSAKMSASIHQ